MKTKLRIAHPDWLRISDPGKTLLLYQKGILPDAIAAWMIVVSLKHPLRAVYGSDLRAALALLWQATWCKVRDEIRYRIWCRLHPKEVAEMDAEFEEEMWGAKWP